MSGRKQHHIPQCLLKGFETPSKGKTKKVWVFKRGQPAYVSSTKDVAAERHFYSELAKDGSATLDDKITAYENKLTKLLVLLRKAPVDSTVDATVAAELITHLTIRGAHLRDVFSFGSKEVITELANIFSNENHMRTLWGIDANVPTPLLREEIDKMVSEQAHHLAQIGLPESLVKQTAFTLLKENFHSFYAGQSLEIVNFLKKIACNIGDFARNGHVKALGKSLIPEPRVVSLRQFSWTLRLAPEGKLILPDCVVVVVRNDDDLPEPYMMSSVKEVNLVLFPICPNRLLVGCRGNATLPEVEDFNKAAAACSHTFFVSAIRTPELEDLAERIGERTKTIVLDAVSSAANEFTAKSIVQEHRSQSMLHTREEQVLSETAIAMENHHIEANDAQNPSYPVVFRDCAD